MKRFIAIIVLLGAYALQPFTAYADEITGVTGSSQPFTNLQPSLGLNYSMPLSGLFPPPSGEGIGVGEQTLGNVRLFAGNFTLGGATAADGRLLPITQNVALFSLFGFAYGGDGRTTFAVPNLVGRTPVQPGTGAGLSQWDLGQFKGTTTVTLTEAQLPAHRHTLPPSGHSTGVTGGSQPFTNIHPSLGLNYVIATQGVFPGPSSGTSGATFLGQVALFAGNFAPTGWAFANGQLLDISQNPALFTLLGTTYGGDGVISFALPDLQGRAVVGTGAGWQLGEMGGMETVMLTNAQMPAHKHTLPPSPDFTGLTGGNQPILNMQPSMALTYLIATTGIYPSSEALQVDGHTYLGELTLYAGNVVPQGWIPADGRLLPVGQNSALFSLFGFAYGGDGRTTFALPDLRGRVAIGAENVISPGVQSGTEFLTLTTDQLSAHWHTIVPKPTTGLPWLMLLLN